MRAPAKPKAKPRPRKDVQETQPPEADEFTRRRDAAIERWREAVDRRDTTQAGQRLVALAHAEVWRCEAAVLQGLGAYDAARKASSSANELEVLAAKLERDGIADRVAELERRLSTTRKAAAKLAELDD